MILALIPKPPPRKSERKNPSPQASVESVQREPNRHESGSAPLLDPAESRILADSDYDEERYIVGVILAMWFFLVVPGLLTLAYIILYPESFH